MEPPRKTICNDTINAGILLSQGISNEKYNAIQKAFVIILGMGELTINKYKIGAVQKEKIEHSPVLMKFLSES